MEEINEIKIPKEPQFKNGDFVYEDGRIMIIDEFSERLITYYALIYPAIDLKVVYYYPAYASSIAMSHLNFRPATDEEKQLLIDAMEKEGKRWNAEKLIVDNIPQPN